MRLIERILGKGREPQDEPEATPHVTDDGKPIKQIWRSDWESSDDGLREYRYHVGRSDGGYHGGLEVSVRGGEGPFKWGLPYTTKADAEMAAYGMRDGWELHQSWQEGTYQAVDIERQPEQKHPDRHFGIER